MKNTYAILGSGMQGTAAAYDLALFGDAKEILMADMSLDQAKKSAEKVNKLTNKDICKPTQLDAQDGAILENFLQPVDVLISCVPYWMHPKVAPVAIKSNTHMIDLGGNTNVTWETLKFDEDAKKAGVSIVPDTGLAPGLVVSIAEYFIEHFDETESIKLYCGGLPQNPKPPFNYKLAFHIEGLLTEYTGKAIALRDGKICEIDTLTELETGLMTELGELEAFVTSGGTSTAPYTWEGKVNNFEYKTFRYPGHCEKMKLFKDYGFWELEPINIKGVQLRPQDLFNQLMGEALKEDDRSDYVVIRGIAYGKSGGRHKEMQLDILDRYDSKTDFTAMERMTGFSASIYAIEIANGNTQPGCLRYENAVSGTRFMAELSKRDINLNYWETKDLDLNQQAVA